MAQTAVPPVSADTSVAMPAGQYIVVLQDLVADAAADARDIAGRSGLPTGDTYQYPLKGFSAAIPSGALPLVQADRRVRLVVPVAEVQPTAQVLRLASTASRRTGAVRAGDGRRAVDGDVAVLASGIAARPDLTLAGGYNCTSKDPTAWVDDAGHGTHVASTIGARDNESDVVGAAPGVRLWAVKVLGDNSVGNTADFDGVPGGAAPAACLESDDTAASFSNFAVPGGPHVAHTLAAPEVCMLSTLPGGTYGRHSGTNLAASHVAGTAALCITDGACRGLAPVAITAKLVTDAAAGPAADGFRGDPKHSDALHS